LPGVGGLRFSLLLCKILSQGTFSAIGAVRRMKTPSIVDLNQFATLLVPFPSVKHES
jgi:hypothetical protein